jgi:hypothetical protein
MRANRSRSQTSRRAPASHRLSACANSRRTPVPRRMRFSVRFACAARGGSWKRRPFRSRALRTPWPSPANVISPAGSHAQPAHRRAHTGSQAAGIRVICRLNRQRRLWNHEAAVCVGTRRAGACFVGARLRGSRQKSLSASGQNRPSPQQAEIGEVVRPSASWLEQPL